MCVVNTLILFCADQCFQTDYRDTMFLAPVSEHAHRESVFFFEDNAHCIELIVSTIQWKTAIYKQAQ